MTPYNPLEKENLGKSVVSSLIGQKALPLGAVSRFTGAGIYAIYYTGAFDAYAPMSAWNQGGEPFNLPIYVGKAVPTGGRKGMIDPEVSAKGAALFSRLDEHRKSIQQAVNLDIEDFWCRFLVVDDIWIPLGESLLIQNYRPLWNSVLDGFGNHDPGAGRHQGAKPFWDTLHPGRPWADRCAPSKLTESQIRHHIAEYWRIHKGPDIEGIKG
ncbi:MAG: Eco29kI family restriction endonuclease [Verrucomicrobiota bacterium]